MDRNYLRHEVLPVLRVRWPGAALTIGRSGRLCAEASGLLEEIGAADARRICRAQRVLLGRLAALSAPRQRNVLRYLCRSRLGSAPPERRLREGLAQLLAAGHDRNPVLAWPGGEIRRYRTALYLLPPPGPRPEDPREALPVVAGATLDLGARLGTMRLVGARGQGLSKRRVGDSLRVSFRHGGERLQPAGSGHRQKLKKLLQERGIVPWMRERIPLLYADSRLVAVAHLWVAAEFVADAGERGFRVRWDGHPDLE
jgi:tRNA(Ile)-lysidine synthase